MLKKRLITAAIAIPIVFAVLAFAPKAFIVHVFLLVAIGTTYEASEILLPALRRRLGSPMLYPKYWSLLCSSVAGVVFYCLAFRSSEAELGLAVVSLLLLLLIANFSAKSIDDSMANMLGALFCVVYGCLPWVSCLDLYDLGSHSRYLFLLLGIVMANDSGAYFVGKSFGKHPLAPQSSPKKTWEGFFAGVLAGVLGGFAINTVFGGALGSWRFIAFAAALTGIAGILGDLTESALKRFGGVKDSGTLFPGHGGLLDRADSIIFAAPVLWFLLYMSTFEHSLF